MKVFHWRGQGKNPPKSYNFFWLNLYICKFLTADQATSIREAMSCSQPKCGKNVNLYSFVQHLLFLEALSQYKIFLFETGQGKLKTHRYLQDGCFMGQEGRVVWQTLGPHLCWAGAAFGWGHRALTHGTGQGWVRLSTPDPPWPFHPPGQHWLHPWLPAGMVWFPTPLHGCLHHQNVAALGLGCCGHQSWRVWGDTSAFLRPLPQRCLWWQVSPPAATETCWKAAAFNCKKLCIEIVSLFSPLFSVTWMFPKKLLCGLKFLHLIHI